VWAGVDNAWEQEKPEARKMPVNRAESHTSGARFVSPRYLDFTLGFADRAIIFSCSFFNS
jgi:hypothetical protein